MSQGAFSLLNSVAGCMCPEPFAPAPVAQLVEHSPGKREAVGSNPGLAQHSCHSSEYVFIRPKRVNVIC